MQDKLEKRRQQQGKKKKKNKSLAMTMHKRENKYVLKKKLKAEAVS